KLRNIEWRYLNRQLDGGIFTLHGHSGAVTGACYSPDGQRIATGSEDGTIRLWSARTGVLFKTMTTSGGVVKQMAFASDNIHVAALCAGRVELWDTSSGKQ